ncbi:MAG: hypothetical protein M3O30_18915 [Planctomycetota bacterium]|nr:hypothetical protein [Planctomycetota bacterium]
MNQQRNIVSRLPDDPTESETTGLPGVRRWSAVYLLVAGSFVLWVVLLTVLQAIFS